MVGGVLQGERVWNVAYVGVEEVCGRVVCSGCSVCVWYVRVVCVGVYVCDGWGGGVRSGWCVVRGGCGCVCVCSVLIQRGNGVQYARITNVCMWQNYFQQTIPHMQDTPSLVKLGRWRSKVRKRERQVELLHFQCLPGKAFI